MDNWLDNRRIIENFSKKHLDQPALWDEGFVAIFDNGGPRKGCFIACHQGADASGNFPFEVLTPYHDLDFLFPMPCDLVFFEGNLIGATQLTAKDRSACTPICSLSDSSGAFDVACGRMAKEFPQETNDFLFT